MKCNSLHTLSSFLAILFPSAAKSSMPEVINVNLKKKSDRIHLTRCSNVGPTFGLLLEDFETFSIIFFDQNYNLDDQNLINLI